MDSPSIRNVGVLAHIDAGKTTVSERMLFCAGVEHRAGEVDAGTTVLDWMPEERERGITIAAAATTLPWRGAQIHLIDTPGHIDFGIEVERTLRVLDGGVLVVDAVAGVQAQTETVWRQMVQHAIPALCFVNKCDRAGADFLAATQSVSARLGVEAVPVQYPYYRDSRLEGMVDLVSLRMHVRDCPGRPSPADSARFAPIPAQVQDEVGVLRWELLDRLRLPAEASADQVLLALRQRTRARELVPVLGGAGLRDMGIQALLDAIVDLLPAPGELADLRGLDPMSKAPRSRPRTPEELLCAYVFKLQAEAHGDVAWLRIFSGRLRAGDSVCHARSGKSERIGHIWRMHGRTRVAQEGVAAGDIVAVSGLKRSVTGDTLCSFEEPMLLESLRRKQPVISMVLELDSSGQREKLQQAMQCLLREDPSLLAKEDETTGQWVLEGMGELHLEVAVHRLQRERGLALRTGSPRVAFREAPTRSAKVRAEVQRQLAGEEIYGCVELELGSRSAGDRRGDSTLEVEFAPQCPVPQAMRAAVRDALLAGSRTGPCLGYPLVDCQMIVTGGHSRGPADSEIGFAQAAGQALREALQTAQVTLLEPLMQVDIRCPSEFTSALVGDLNARRVQIQVIETQGTWTRIQGLVPLAHMLGYATVARSLSQGRAEFSLQPAGFREVPAAELERHGFRP